MCGEKVNIRLRSITFFAAKSSKISVRGSSMSSIDTSREFKPGWFANFKYDFPAGIVVFLVAVPLCLGIALASNAPLLSGLIAGIVGGMIVSMLSGSELSVTGPAAGLTVIVASSIAKLGSFEAFLAAVVVAGIIQIIFGVLRAGIIGVIALGSMMTAKTLSFFSILVRIVPLLN
jgi:MFS superfamily sulfate permease-like transporter